MDGVRAVFAARLRELRKAAGLTQKQVADILRQDRSTYAYYEAAKTTPSYDALLRIAAIYDVPVQDLLGQSSNESRWTLKDGSAAAESGAPGFKGLWRDEALVLGLYRQLDNVKCRMLQNYLIENLGASVERIE